MIYPKDFAYLSNEVHLNHLLNQRQRQFETIASKLNEIKKPTKLKTIAKLKKKYSFYKIYQEYCTISSVHGVKYLVDESFNWFQRYVFFPIILNMDFFFFIIFFYSGIQHILDHNNCVGNNRCRICIVFDSKSFLK